MRSQSGFLSAALIAILLKGLAVAAVFAALGYAVHRYAEAKREEGRVQVQQLWDQERAAFAEAAASAAKAAREEEARRANAQKDIIDEALRRAQESQAIAVAAASAADRLRNAASRAAAAASSRCASVDPAAASASSAEPQPSPSDLLADVLGRLDRATEDIGAFADRSDSTANACERLYDSLIVSQPSGVVAAH